MTTLFSGRQLTLKLDGTCATLTFNNPDSLNALTAVMASECLAATELLQAEQQVSLLVLRGAGRAFVAGGDLQALYADPTGAASAIIEPMHACLRLWQQAPWVTLAVVQGVAAGAGLSLLAGADLVLASDRARFVYAYSDIETTPDLGLSWSLVQRIGRARALEMALLGHSLDAPTALAWGLVNRLVPAAQLENEARHWQQLLCGRNPDLVRATCELFSAAPQRSLSDQLDAERASFLRCAAKPVFREAIGSFLKR
ncbi:enoyl-CoA hydratase/isomerase family protein [Halopseudomonas maritima]|uniref:enoyl-CoA hydratase/isomerase family protein n=1 Tax=Halopseudomonas maritima TaxID=2918528 RepID=UPI001EEC2B32|nr:enoyl-CoA hydratase/isomerase family protein [Halopseudomonas maritima]UJJ31537.1 enoyl-CoA hydratase/isomerase family protein [Halopseudomonas maritima]